MTSSRLRQNASLAAMLLFVAAGRSSVAPAKAAFVSEVSKLSAIVPTSLEGFGRAVAINGNRALVGTSGIVLPGAAYLFDVPTGQLLHKLASSDTARLDRFGSAVAMNGHLAVVGAPGRGAAYLFDIATGQELFKLTASDGERSNRFGESVAISGNSVLVGAPFQNGSQGAAYLFDAQTGQQLAKLRADDEHPLDPARFGWSVAMDGSLAVLGVGGREGGSVAAYIFDVETGQQLRKLTPSDRPLGGSASVVAISGDTVTMGDPGNREFGLTNAGAAYVFDALTGRELFKFTAPDRTAYDYFGNSVGMSDDLAVVAAINADIPQGIDAGAVYLFDLTTGEQLATLTASDATANAWFGTVAFDGNLIIVGAPGISSFGTGSAYIYSIVPEPDAGVLALMLALITVLRPFRQRFMNASSEGGQK